MTAEAGTREFGTRSIKATQIFLIGLFALVVGMKVAMLSTFLWTTYQVSGSAREILADDATVIGVALLDMALIAGVCILALWQLRREAARARVEVTEEGLAITDWRGRTRTANWPELEKVQLSGLALHARGGWARTESVFLPRAERSPSPT